jgi:hypothetical protein
VLRCLSPALDAVLAETATHLAYHVPSDIPDNSCIRTGRAGKVGSMNDHTGPLTLRNHAMLEPLVGLVFIAAPWIFGFSDADDATTVSIVLGALVLLTGLTTRWRMGVVKLLSLGAHRMMDVLVALVAIVSPFVLGFSDNGAATRFLIIMGVLEIGATLMTNWDARDEFAVDTAHHASGGSAGVAR